MWLFFSAGCVAVYPLWEGRKTSARTLKAIYRDLTGRGGVVTHGRATIAETVDAQEAKEGKRDVGAAVSSEKGAFDAESS